MNLIDYLCSCANVVGLEIKVLAHLLQFHVV